MIQFFITPSSFFVLLGRNYLLNYSGLEHVRICTPYRVSLNAVIDDKNMLTSSLSRSSLLNMLPPVPSDFNPTNIGNPSILNKIPTPPPSLVGSILTAVPGEVVADLMNPLSRDSLASAFQAGDMPEWYKSLPTGVKSYFSEVAAQMTASSVTYQPTGPIATGAPEGSLRTTSSEALGSTPTGAVTGSFLVAAGILGAAIAL